MWSNGSAYCSVTGTHPEQEVVTHTAAPDEKTPGSVLVMEAAVNDCEPINPETEDQPDPVLKETTGKNGGQMSVEMAEQPEEKATEPSVSTPDFKNSSTKSVEVLRSGSSEIIDMSLDREGKKKELTEYEGTARHEIESVVDDEEPVRSSEGDTSVANGDDEIMLNTTYTISPPEGHLEDPQSVLSESLSKTPKQTGEKE